MNTVGMINSLVNGISSTAVTIRAGGPPNPYWVHDYIPSDEVWCCMWCPSLTSNSQQDNQILIQVCPSENQIPFLEF